MTVEVTSISSKGQVVIPSKIRHEIGLEEGGKLMILTDGHNLLLKPISAPKLEIFKTLIKESRQAARKTGLTKSRLIKTIKNTRSAHASRH